MRHSIALAPGGEVRPAANKEPLMPADHPVVVAFQTPHELARQAQRVAGHLRRGGLVAYPTETVYGFGCAVAAGPLERLAALKDRGTRKPFLLLVAGPEQVPDLLWRGRAQALAAAFWPGPLTLVLRAEPGRYPAQVVGPGSGVAVRQSPHPAVAAMLDAYGAPIVSTSANLPGAAPAMCAEQAISAVRALGASGEVWVLDGGSLPPSPPSTVVDCSGSRPRLLRSGAIGTEDLRRIADGIDV